MSWDHIDEKKFKTLVKQISGTITAKDGELVPFHMIKGEGPIWCYQPTTRKMIRIMRGMYIYVLDQGTDNDEECLALTVDGVIFVIDKEEIEKIGYN